MRKGVTFSKQIEEKLLEYRKQRHDMSGKVMFRQTAIEQLLLKALSGIEPVAPLHERLASIEKRLNALEGK